MIIPAAPRPPGAARHRPASLAVTPSALWRADPRLPAWSPQALLVWCGTLLSTLSNSLRLPMILAGVVLAAVAGRGQDPRGPAHRLAAAAVPVSGVVLAAAANIHGAALLTGILFALGLRQRGRS